MMLGRRLRSVKRFTCRYGCCTINRSHIDRKTKHERARDTRVWRKEVVCDEP